MARPEGSFGVTYPGGSPAGAAALWWVHLGRRTEILGQRRGKPGWRRWLGQSCDGGRSRTPRGCWCSGRPVLGTPRGCWCSGHPVLGTPRGCRCSGHPVLGTPRGCRCVAALLGCGRGSQPGSPSSQGLLCLCSPPPFALLASLLLIYIFFCLKASVRAL